MKYPRQEATGPVTIGTSLIELVTIVTWGHSLLILHIANATQALNDFDVLYKAHPSADFEDSTPASWLLLPAGGPFVEILGSNRDLAALAAGEHALLKMDVSGIDRLQFKAKAAGASAAVTLHWSLF